MLCKQLPNQAFSVRSKPPPAMCDRSDSVGPNELLRPRNSSRSCRIPLRQGGFQLGLAWKSRVGEPQADNDRPGLWGRALRLW